MKLLIEQAVETEFITEGAGAEKKMYISGIFMQCIPNKNGRIYPESTLHKEVDRYTREVIGGRKAWGELGHPDGPQINLDRVSHIIESLKIDGKNVIGKARLTNTPKGEIAKGLIESGGSLGVSTRGLGTLKPIKDNLQEVQEDFRLITAADIVADPSAPDAFVRGIMENAEWIQDAAGNWEKQQIIEDTRKSLKTMTLKEIEAAKYRIWASVLHKLITA